MKRLQSLTNRPYYTSIFRFLQNMQRSRDSTDIYQFHKRLIQTGLNVEITLVFEFFEDLMNVGMGVFVQGRGRERPPRFIWKYSARSVGAAALTPSEELITIEDMRVHRMRPQAARAREYQVIRIPFPLTPSEAEKYISQIKKLVDRE